MGLRSFARLRSHQRELPYVSNLFENYSRAPVTFVSGSGCELVSTDGRTYLDFIGGIAVCAVGHANAAIAQAVSAQAAQLVHVSNLFRADVVERLARTLCERSGFDRVFFCNSGTEANEAAIKLARKFAFRNGTGKNVILSCTGGFHGRTLGALAATPNAAYHEGFGPMPDGFKTTPFNDIAALHEHLTDGVAALIIEPVQGESGVHAADREFLQAARELCTERGALLIFDEIQCGMGRIGPLFAFHHFGVVPDVVTLAKALANGLPIGAVLAPAAVAAAFRPGDHGSTFGGSPVPCAAALAHLRERDRLHLEERTDALHAYFMDALQQLAKRHPRSFGEPRGLGLLLGLPVLEPHTAAVFVDELRARHAILANAAGGNTLRFAPPLIVSEQQIDRVVSALDALAAARIPAVTPRRNAGARAPLQPSR